MIPSTLTRFPVPNANKHPTALHSHPHVSLWRWCSLGWAPVPSYSKHRQHLYGQRARVWSHLNKGHVTSMHSFSPGCPLNFSLAWRCLFFTRGVLLHSSFLLGSLVSVFVEISGPDLTKSFTSVLTVVLGSVETSLNRFLYKVFWNLSLPAAVLFKRLDNISHGSSWHLKTLW